MASILVLDSDAEERALAIQALEAAGHRVVAPAEGKPGAADLALVDAVVAELDAAVAAGLLRAGAPARVPLVVATRFTSLLPPLGDRVAAFVRKPIVGAALVDAVTSVLEGRPSSKATLPSRVADAPYPGTTPDPELQGIAELVSRGIGTPTGLVTVLSGDLQFFVGHAGLPPDLLASSATPRAWSLCQHAASAEAPLVVSDAREHPALAANPAVIMNLVRAYAGVPIEVPGYGAVGTVCVVSPVPRAFTRSDLAILELGARLASARLAQRFADEVPLALRASAELASPGPLGELLGDKYYVTGRLGDGGQSNVLFARDRLTAQLVAIKVVREAIDEGLLVREAAALSKVRHPNVVQVHGWGRTGEGRLYIVLEYVSGRTLADRLAEVRATGEPMMYQQAIKIVREVGGALATLHAAGVVHGDLKPSNVILDATLDRSVLIDFGLGLAAHSGEGGGAAPGGTPGYSAPEQLVGGDGREMSEAVDVYGLAALAYATLVGVGPFERVRGSMRTVAQLHGEAQPPSTLRVGLPEQVDRVLLRALSPDPSLRPASVVTLVDRLEAAMAGASPPSRSTTTFEPRSRGTAFRDYRLGVRAMRGEAAEAALFASLPADVREAFGSAVDPHEFYPAAPMVAYLSAAAGDDLATIEALGEGLAGPNLASALAAMHVARTPEAMLHVVQPLMARFHDWARVDARLTGTREGVARVRMPVGFAPVMCRYFAGVAKALMATGGRKATVTPIACAAEGAPACELKIAWTEA